MGCWSHLRKGMCGSSVGGGPSGVREAQDARGEGCSGHPRGEDARTSRCRGRSGLRLCPGCCPGRAPAPSRCLPSLPSCLPSPSADLGQSSSADATGVPRVGTSDLWVEMRSPKCHHSKLIPNGGFFYLFFVSQPLFPPSHPSPVGISHLVPVGLGCATGVDKHLLLRCHKLSFPPQNPCPHLGHPLPGRCHPKNAKRGHGDVSCITPISPFQKP